VAKPFTGTLTQIVIPTPELWGRNLLVALDAKSRFLAGSRPRPRRVLCTLQEPTDVPGEDAGRSGSGNPVGNPGACYAPCLDLIVI
jgi:hypothetical protein